MPALWDHQRKMVATMRRFPGAGIWAEMGTGKTLATLVYLAERRAPTTLVVAPKAVVAGRIWSDDARKHDVPLRVVELVKGGSKQRAQQLKDAMRDGYDATPLVVVVNYESVWRGALGEAIRRHKWGALVLDESHRAKSWRSTAAKYLCALSRHIPKRIALTGTPMPHSPLDAFQQYRILNPTIFGTSVMAFRRRYCVMGGYQDREIVQWVNQDEFTRRFRSISIHVGGDVLDLPPVRDLWLWTDLTTDARRVYDRMRRESITALGLSDDEFERAVVSDLSGEHVASAPNALVRGLRLQQIAGGHLTTEGGGSQIVDDTKRDLLADWLDGLDPKEPCVVFARFRPELARIREVAKAADRPCREISGATNDYQAWRDADRPGVLAVQIQSGGTGLDFTRARYACYWSTGYSLGDYLQSRARLHRPGQSAPVAYYHLGARNTIDVAIAAALKTRLALVTSWSGKDAPQATTP